MKVVLENIKGVEAEFDPDRWVIRIEGETFRPDQLRKGRALYIESGKVNPNDLKAWNGEVCAAWRKRHNYE